jgi:hypothetical protein
VPIEAHEWIIRSDLIGHLNDAHAVLPIFEAQGRRGRAGQGLRRIAQTKVATLVSRVEIAKIHAGSRSIIARLLCPPNNQIGYM